MQDLETLKSCRSGASLCGKIENAPECQIGTFEMEVDLSGDSVFIQLLSKGNPVEAKKVCQFALAVLT